MRTEQRELLILVNPRAGKGFALRSLRDARKHLWGRRLRIEAPVSLEDLRQVLRGANPRRTDAIIVMGGDGSFHQVLRNLPQLPNEIPVLPFPVGTANDFAIELKINQNWQHIQELLDHRSVEAVDVVTANGVPFVTTAGIGLGSDLSNTFNRARTSSSLVRAAHGVLGRNVYQGLAALKLIGGRKLIRHIRVCANDFDEKMSVAAVFVCNQSRLAGNIQVAPKINNDDNRFSVLIVPRRMRLTLVSQMLLMRSQKLPRDLISFSTRDFEIHSIDKTPLSVFGDGEAMLDDPIVRFSVHPHKLYVLRAPRGMT